MFQGSLFTNKNSTRHRIGGKEVQEEKLLSEGGYAYVFKVQDCHTGEIYAMKKMICQNKERLKTAQNEINALKNIPTSPNIMAYHGSEIVKTDDGWIAYLLIEFCEGGSVFDLMQKYEKSKLQEKQILFVLREVCEGVRVMHSMNPPIAHRDIKIENVLLNNKSFKLCDFGSCSTDQIDLERTPKSDYFQIEEVFARNTTLMYRPPEMCDLYQQYPINQKADIWMIGCMLYTMCYYRHPFIDMSKLAIVNATFVLPDEPKYPEKLKDLIRLMLTPDPRLRPDISDVFKLVNNYDSITSVKLNEQALEIKGREAKRHAEMQSFEGAQSKIKKFDGDIPDDELEKLRQKLAKNRQAEQGGLKDWDEIADNFNSKVTIGNSKKSDDPFSNPKGNSNPVKKTTNSSDWDQWGNSGPNKASTDVFSSFNTSGANSQKTSDVFAGFGGFGGFGNDSSQNNVPLHKNFSQPAQKGNWDGFDFGNKTESNASTNNAWGSFGVETKAKADAFQSFGNNEDAFNLHRATSDKPGNFGGPSGWNDWGSNNNASGSNFNHFNSAGPQQHKQQPQPQQTVDLLELADSNAPKEKVDLNLIDF